MGLRNVTITLDQEVVRWARVAAAERETSLARFVGEVLREKMSRDRGYDAAMKDFLSHKPRVLKGPGQAYPDREDLHDRSALR